MSESERQDYRETQDASTDAVFRSAFDEALAGGSTMHSSSSTASGAAEASTGIIGAIFGGGGVSGGYSGSASSGSTSSWQNTSRDFASSAAQDMHAALGRTASASRRASQTSIRVASSSERQQVTTRVVTNHNHNHALTMQWWQVLRHFAVTSAVDDVTLVCFVPLQPVAFLPAGQPTTLPDSTTRPQLLDRYAMVLQYYDVLLPFFARRPEYAYGMRVLRDFAADPDAVPQSADSQQDVIDFRIEGSFMPFDEVSVTVVGRSGARLGPTRLTLLSAGSSYQLTPGTYTSRASVLAELQKRRRRTDDPVTLAASIPLPPWLSRGDVVRFDVTRRTQPFSYQLSMPAGLGGAGTELVDALFGAHTDDPGARVATVDVDDLEEKIGGPVLQNAHARLPGNQINLGPLQIFDGPDLLGPQSFTHDLAMPATMSMAAVRTSPVLSHDDLLRIEAVFAHVVRNTMSYSTAVWASLTEHERAVMLEPFTIGVPDGGVTSADQEVPLLNCVANRFLGFFGNSAIMPFSIPPQVAASMQVSSRDIQDALLRFHRQAFRPPRSSLTLPARGTLGEAVLGSCASSEKVDLTRFWNWQDAPADAADSIPQSAYLAPSTGAAAAAAAGAGPASPAGAGAAAPGSIITISNGQPAAVSTDLAGKLAAGAPDLAQQVDMTGLSTLQKQISTDTQSAAAGRKEAVDSVTQIQTQAMKSAEGIVKSVADAAASIFGGGAGAAAKGAGKAAGSSDGGGSSGGGNSGGGNSGGNH